MSSSSGSTSSSVHQASKTKMLLNNICGILNEIVEDNRNNPDLNKEILEKQKKYSFHSKNPSSISVDGYLERAMKYTHIEESTLVIALIYIDRICELNNFLLND